MLVSAKCIYPSTSLRTMNLGGTTGRESASRPIMGGRFFVNTCHCEGSAFLTEAISMFTGRLLRCRSAPPRNDGKIGGTNAG